MNENELSKIIIGCAIEVHKILGPGLLESSYESCLEYELIKKNLKVEKQKTLRLVYKDIIIESAYRVDLFVENKVIIEIKTVQSLTPLHNQQLRTYLRLADCRLGLLINFNVSLLKDGIERVVNNL